MHTLDNPRHEAFVLHKRHPSRLAYGAKVAERIAGLRGSKTLSKDNSPVAPLAALARLIKAGVASDTINFKGLAGENTPSATQLTA